MAFESCKWGHAMKEIVPLLPPETHERMLFMAAADLDASVLLYKRRCYPQAVFLLQQSVEKATKSFGMYFVGITEEEARSGKMIGHRSIRVFEHSCTRISDNIAEINNAVEADPEMRLLAPLITPGLSQMEAKIREIALDFHRTADGVDANRDLPLDDLKERIRMVEELEIGLQEAERKLAGEEQQEITFTGEEVASLKTDVHALLDPLYAGVPDHRRAVERNIEGLIDLLNDRDYLQRVLGMAYDFIGAASGFICLSTIIQPHAVSARYPSGNFDPLEFYTRDRGLVRALPALYRIAYRSMDRLYNLYGTYA